MRQGDKPKNPCNLLFCLSIVTYIRIVLDCCWYQFSKLTLKTLSEGKRPPYPVPPNLIIFNQLSEALPSKTSVAVLAWFEDVTVRPNHFIFAICVRFRSRPI
jgi:hypothetical protein